LSAPTDNQIYAVPANQFSPSAGTTLGWNAQTRAVPTTSTNGDTSQMLIMHELDLYNKTVADLRAICNQYNIRTGKSKKDYVETILKHSNTMNHNLNIVKAVLSTTNLADPAPMHVFYRDYFNLIDLIDRRWYAVGASSLVQKLLQ